jgi:hypothetical protein
MSLDLGLYKYSAKVVPHSIAHPLQGAKDCEGVGSEADQELKIVKGQRLEGVVYIVSSETSIQS